MTAFDICSQSGSVESWLAEQPKDPEDYEPPLSGNTKRLSPRRGIGCRKRRCLSEIEPNTVLMDPPKKRQQASPRKRKTKDAATQPSSLALQSRTRSIPDQAVFEDNAQENEQENEETPRASRKTLSLKGPPKLDPPDVSDEERSSQHDDRSTSNANTTSTSRKRSPSPRKTRFNMTLAEVKVIPVAIGSGDATFPAEVQQLYDELDELQTQQGLLPPSIRDRARHHLVRDRSLYYREESASIEGESAAGQVRDWEDILDIRDAAGECAMEDAPESSWNMDVNFPLLRTALRGHWKAQEIWYKDLTTSRIYDKDLLPKVPGVNPKSKMVDLGIVVKPRRLGPLWNKVAGKCSNLPYNTVNQTDATHVCQSPIAISGEVKRAGGDEIESLVQLGTWVTAHYNHLQILLKSAKSAAKLPALPLLQIIGDRWRLIIAEMKPEDGQIILHSNIELGSTNNILGIYQIIASIRLLAKWMSEQYRPWWVRSILGSN